MVTERAKEKAISFAKPYGVRGPGAFKQFSTNISNTGTLLKILIAS